jgi:hypothetical protein
MYIYKFTHIETGRCYIGQTIQDPNHFGGKTWKLIDGKRVWLAKEATV